MIYRNVLAVDQNRGERAPGTHQRTPIRPIEQILRSGLTARRRIGQWKDDGPRNIAGHRLDHLPGEYSGLARYTDHDGRLRILNHIQQGNPAWLSQLPARHLLPFSHEG